MNSGTSHRAPAKPLTVAQAARRLEASEEFVLGEVEAGRLLRLPTGLLDGVAFAKYRRAQRAKEELGTYRTWFDAGLTAKLDRIAKAGGYRGRPAVLRALIEDVPPPSEGFQTSEAVTALSLSNHTLGTLTRDLSALSRDGRVPDGQSLKPLVRDIRAHLERSAEVVALLRPLLEAVKYKVVP